ncbi:MAG: hypothetical protein LQ338_002078 [Usnochroma carphineum]|nr:MAG: hypothetical protein LQ338_002078 [Usnochroma carphineum]
MGSLPTSLDIFLSTKFTHLVVGGGTAGLVVAARLAENNSITVGVLEAGHAAYDHPGINVPGRFGETLGTDYDWQFATVPQPGLNGRSLPWPRGKVLGGTSALNFMTWNRACKEDYDAWEALGNQGWGWESMLPFFMKSERLHESDSEHQLINHSYFNSKFHGKDGPIHTAYSTQYGASHPFWHKTLHSLGVDTNRSHFGGSNVGAWTSLTSVEPEQRERSYSATAYYKPNAGKSNLVVLTGATVQELLLTKSHSGDWIASGARFAYEGTEYSVNVDGEVILCAGSVQSPQLLELSGIGNPDVLQAAGIKVKVNNPAVGENLQEHMMTMMVYEIDPAIPTVEELRTDPDLAKAADHQYETTRSGPRTTVPSSVAYLPFSHYLDPEDLKRLGSSLHSAPLHQTGRRKDILIRRFTHDQRLGQIEYNFDLSNYSPFFTSERGKKYATMLQMLQYPFSTGSIHVPVMKKEGKRTTVDDKLVIDPRYYGGEGGKVDFEMMAAAQKFADLIVGTKPLADIIVRRAWPPPPPDAGHEGDEDFGAWVRDNTVTDWHPVGTCAMGGEGVGDGFVVDARLRVYGVQGLRVVDASVMPLQISAHLQATVYAIGEKGASMVLEDWEKGREGRS